MEKSTDILLIGFGNPGRLDDGLGPALAARVEAWKLPGVTVDSDYQLTVEDASDLAKHEVVIFADAALTGREPFYLEEVKAEAAQSFSTHSVEPPALMDMAAKLFGARTRGFMLGIRGYEFNEFGERLSAKATSNLEQALQYIRLVLEDPRLLEDSRLLDMPNRLTGAGQSRRTARRHPRRARPRPPAATRPRFCRRRLSSRRSRRRSRRRPPRGWSWRR